MKRIYKRIEVASSEILLTLALFSDVGGTESVDAEDLDRLEAQLSRPNYTGAEQLLLANVQRSHLEITNEGDVLAVLHRLKRGENIFVCKARYGTNISVQLTIDFVVTAPNETIPVEISENVVLVESIGDGGGGEFPTDYAKQGTDPNATLTDTQAYAQAAAADAAAAKAAAQSLTSLDSDINAGKAAIAQAVTAKGVQTSPTDTMLQMATNVTQITQAPISINGGEMYAKQLYGSLITPNYWNLYEVLANLLSDGRLNNYGGILLAEYYKGYDSIALAGAGAGGAYVVSDKDSNGNFIMYTEDSTHAWDTEFDGTGNRWVAYCFADEYHDFQITDTNTSPRSILIGRNVGTIKLLANSRTAQVVVPDGNILADIDTNGFTMNYGRCVVLRNISNHTSSSLVYPQNTEQVYIDGGNLSGNIFAGTSNYSTEYSKIASIIIKCNSFTPEYIFSTLFYNIDSALSVLVVDAETIVTTFSTSYTPGLPNLKNIVFLNVETLLFRLGGATNRVGHETKGTVYIGYKTNDKTKSVILSGMPGTDNGFSLLSNVELKDGWCKPLNVSACVALTEANMYAHILQRLKQDEADCGDGVTITLGATNLAKLTSQESIDLLDVLTNIYGYTFA